MTRHDEQARTTFISAEARHYAWLLVAQRFAQYPSIDVEAEFRTVAMKVGSVYAKLKAEGGMPVGDFSLHQGSTFNDWKLKAE
ncbi:MAG: hypothetical protein KKI08_11835 [Armatimonadetes bacterium]|nr:hypothetical protein [Armatimonadota bacterium]